jgi:hypothetical protein
VVIENVSEQPNNLEGEANPHSFELTEADDSVLKIAQGGLDGALKGFAFRLAPGNCWSNEVYYTTRAQYFAVTRHAHFAGRTWSPEFPFTRTKDKTVTLRAIYERRSPTPCKVVLVYPQFSATP